VVVGCRVPQPPGAAARHDDGDDLTGTWNAAATGAAPGRRAVHVVALIRDDVAKIRRVTSEIAVEPIDRQEARKAITAHLERFEINDAVVLRGVEGIEIRHTVTTARIAHPTIARIRITLKIGAPRKAGIIELGRQA